MLRTTGHKKRPDQSERIIPLPRQNPLCRLRPIQPGSIPPKTGREFPPPALTGSGATGMFSAAQGSTPTQGGGL
jgi:hypothetical protein